MITRIKAIHWAWWGLWLVSLGMMGLLLRNHPTAMIKEMAEAFRYPWGLLPIDVLALRNLQGHAAIYASISAAMVFVALGWVRMSPLFMALAVAVVMLFLTVHATMFMITAVREMNVIHKEMNTTVAKQPAGPEESSGR